MREKNRYFLEEEARRLLGRRFRTKVDFAGIPKGSVGKVVGVDTSYTPRGFASLEIQWEIPVADKYRGLHLPSSSDWFTKLEFENFLEEV